MSRSVVRVIRPTVHLIRRRVLETRTLAMQEEPEIATDPGPEERAEARDLVDRARAAMASLTPGQRAALELAYFQGKTSSEVAELEGIPLGTAKTRIRAGLRRLRTAYLQDANDVEGEES